MNEHLKTCANSHVRASERDVVKKITYDKYYYSKILIQKSQPKRIIMLLETVPESHKVSETNTREN